MVCCLANYWREDDLCVTKPKYCGFYVLVDVVNALVWDVVTLWGVEQREQDEMTEAHKGQSLHATGPKMNLYMV